MMMLYLILIALFVGFAIKQLDFIIDVERRKTSLLDVIVLVFLSGILLGILLSKESNFSTIGYAVLLAQVFSGKLDDRSFWLLGGIALGTAYIIGIPSIDVSAFIFLFIAAILDEVEWKHWLLDKRPFLPLASLIWFLLFNDPTYLMGIISFDIGYHTSEIINKKNYILATLPRM